MDLTEPFEKMEQELDEVNRKLSDPKVISNQHRLRELSQRHAELQKAVDLWHEYQRACEDRDEAAGMLQDADDDEMRDFLATERDQAARKVQRLQNQLLKRLVPKDPMDEKNAVVEIRSGTGGEEAALFAGDLFGMYSTFAERRGWKVRVVGTSESEMGGYKEVSFVIEGKGAYGTMKHESGVHRVQRVPETESHGRIHTSAASVVVLPEAEDVDVDIDEGELTIEAFRAGGPGGQHMQKNETAVRITHDPTGISVVSSSERSQHQNRSQALRLLRSKLMDRQREQQRKEKDATRRQAIKSGDRSVKIRTYNWPQDRVTDHRIKKTVHNIPQLMNGEIEELIKALEEHEEAERLKQVIGE